MPARGIFLLSAVLLALQGVLMRALAFAQGHHLAAVVLSVAMLGFGAGGSVLTLWRKRSGTALETLCGPAVMLCALSLALFAHPAVWLLKGLQVDLLGTDPGQIPRITGLGLLMFFPFGFGAFALSAAFSARPESIGRLYAANLTGSAVGAAGVLAGLRLAFPEQLLAGLAALTLLAAFGLGLSRRLWFACAGIVLAAALTVPELPRSQYKALSHALLLPGAEASTPLPHPRGRLDAVQADALRFAPDVSLQYRGPVPAPRHVFLDGNSAGVFVRSYEPGADILRHTPRGLMLQGPPPRHALLIEPGGTPLWEILQDRAEEITLLEPHPLLAGWLREAVRYFDHTHLVVGDPRSFLARPHGMRPDLIVFPERGMFGGPTGLHTLGEDMLFTVEGIRAAWRLLPPEGRMSFKVWLDEPLRHAPRVVDLIGSALRAEGVSDPAEHVVALRGWGSMSLQVYREPADAEALAHAETFARDKGFDVLMPATDAPRTHAGGGTDLDEMLAALLGKGAEAWRASYRFDIRAPTDDRPFFNQFIRWEDRDPDLEQLSVSERGLHVLRLLAGMLAVAVAVLVLGPLLPLRTSARGASFTVLTFAGLGAGFMFYEISLLQRFTLLWGHPVTSATLVVTGALCGMAGGSALSRRLPASPNALRRVLGGIVMLHLGLTPLLGPAVEALLAAPAAVRFAAGLLLAGLPAVPMGLPFPLGVRILSGRDPRHIPWACGIDSALAVLAAPAASLLAYRAGITGLGFAAAGAYALALLGSFSGGGLKAGGGNNV